MYPTSPRSELSRRTFFGLSALGVLTVAGCRSAVDEAAKTSGTSATPKPGGTLVGTVAAEPFPNAYFTGRPGNIFWNRNVLETLVLIDEKAKPHGLLAREWEFRDGNKALVFKLREGVKFHSGRDFTAEDVVFTVERAAAGDGLANLVGGMKGWKATANGQYEVTITSPRPMQATALDILDAIPIVDKESYKGLQDGSKVIGTGPFVWSGYRPGTEITLKRNDSYWEKGLPYLDGITVTVIKDSTAQLAALRTGRAQLANGLTIQDSKTIVDDKAFQLDENHGLVYGIGFDVNQAPFNNPDLRRAIGYAIDRERIKSQVFGDVGTITSLPWSDNTVGYPKDLAGKYTFDQAKARQLIQQAGANGAKFEIALHALPVPRAIYQIIARNLTDVGLQPSPVELSSADFEPRRATGKLGPAFLTWTAVAGLPPALMVDALSELRPDNNTSRFVDATYQQQVTNLVAAADDKATSAALREVSETLLDDAFFHTYAITPTTTVRAASDRDNLIGRYGRSMRATYLAG
ncbi:peptide/nickel transport system substrate-binding protein [Kibdelosporangium banguiense]|uniref:Peptide/nickel transport system substrate-binding protein n=1 Tax=Kibdelosporangium banguiense TaxID=1365924 RepID=A0ABS4TRA1_9PSEU|nr:ABC transporter substrate-binding protein [Kibdelosporangium banguiense]MBP2326944.1 peptide/nickel transport system substrate-binding protein [Kibdelosporangium banguiense]